MVLVIPTVIKVAIRRHKTTPATWLLMLLIIAFSVCAMRDRNVMLALAFAPATLLSEPQSLLSYSFVCAGVVSLFWALLFMFVFSRALEQRVGYVFYAFVVLGSVLIQAISYLVLCENPYVAIIGPEGLISGIMGAACVVNIRARSKAVAVVGILPLFLEISVVWLLLSLMFTKITFNVSSTALAAMSQVLPQHAVTAMADATNIMVKYVSLPIKFIPLAWGMLCGFLYKIPEEAVAAKS